MTFVDTNYFLRYLLVDVLEQHKQAKELFYQGAAGKIKLYTSIIVLFEIYWVFSSFYEKSKQEVIEILEAVLSLSFIEAENRGLFEAALKMFKTTSLELEDCYNVACAREQKMRHFATFDKNLSKLWQRQK